MLMAEVCMPPDDGHSDYRPGSIKHTRRTKVQLTAILEATREAVDVDAMPLHVIRELVEHCVVQHIDPYQWQREKEIEAQERAKLDVFVQVYKEGMV